MLACYYKVSPVKGMTYSPCPEITLMVLMCIFLDVCPACLWAYVFMVMGSNHIHLRWVHNGLYADTFLPLPAVPGTLGAR